MCSNANRENRPEHKENPCVGGTNRAYTGLNTGYWSMGSQEKGNYSTYKMGFWYIYTWVIEQHI